MFFRGISPDLRSPTIAITSPGNGAGASGVINLTCNAADDRAVVGVQWKVDGVNLGAERTVAPFSTTMDTNNYSDAAHTISAVVRDAVGHTATASVVVNVNNTPAGGVVFGPIDWPPGDTRHYIPLSAQSWATGYNTPAVYIGNYHRELHYYIANDGQTGRGMESGPGPGDIHYLMLNIGGTNVITLSTSGGGLTADAGWFFTSASGGVTLYEWYSTDGHTAFTNGIHLDYRYVHN